jgi:hypothetical protein
VTSVPADLAGDATDSDNRSARLSRATAGIAGRVRSVSVDRWLFYAGCVLSPLGVALILLAWYGTAHTSRLYEQIPYVVSGGLLGLGLLFAGGFAYFAYWLTQLVNDNKAQAARTVASLERIEELLRSGAVGAAGAVASPATSSAAAAGLVATASGGLVHRPDCPMVAGKAGLRAVDPGKTKLRPCKICDPLGA